MAVQQTLRPYVTAGIAIVGSGLIAATPVATPLASGATVRDVALTAGDTLPDLMAPWTAVFNEASQNATTLLQNYYLAPNVGFQQMLANQTQFWQEILDDPSKIPAVMQQMQANLDAVLTGYTLQNASGGVSLNGFEGVIGTVASHTISGTDLTTLAFGHDLLFGLLPQFLPADISSFATPIVDFLASPLSGIIIGSLGPSIAPWVAMMNSIQDGDSFNQVMASWMNGFLNGATLNLDSLLPLIAQTGLLPAGTEITHLDFALGGLLTPGTVAVGPYGVDLPDGSTTDVSAVGGSIFNSLGITLTASLLPGVPISIESQAVGPIAAMEAWGQTVGALLGSGWTGKGPVDVGPPWPGIDFPTVPDGLFDDGGAGSGAASDALAGLDLGDIANALLGIS
ncbi:outer membrane porin GjpA [Mycolicibacter sp. MYC123]|uniref:Outer membrane porin GjpA n=1 Tax=[Mycobacterium] zoologicum TaxID=2872311 RepID=A0ABU5YKC7_9MYCO|nr:MULTISPECIES: outer membrane porin GjpA [unclassified Mycolicibacter]MEB3050503.1 outer membrane porin GjpA [Mycolicibacter sp. MYC123]MEB3065685.1 outer membrane porin GjpA [Mycolicibacter sp. MYC101]